MDKFFLSPCRMVQGFGSGRYKNMPLKLKKLGFLAAGIFKTRGRCGAPVDQNRVAIVIDEKYSSKREMAAAEMNGGKSVGVCEVFSLLIIVPNCSAKMKRKNMKPGGICGVFGPTGLYLF